MKKTYPKTAYSEKLKDPRWQKLRLEVMNRSDFCCEICGDGGSTLHVHHKEYIKGKEPWEYSPGQLASICDDCHSEIHSLDDGLKNACSYLNLDGPCDRNFFQHLISGAVDLPINEDSHSYHKRIYEAGKYVDFMVDHLDLMVVRFPDGTEVKLVDVYGAR